MSYTYIILVALNYSKLYRTKKSQLAHNVRMTFTTLFLCPNDVVLTLCVSAGVPYTYIYI